MNKREIAQPNNEKMIVYQTQNDILIGVTDKYVSIIRINDGGARSKLFDWPIKIVAKSSLDLNSYSWSILAVYTDTIEDLAEILITVDKIYKTVVEQLQ